MAPILKLCNAALAAGWRHAVGDALRDARGASAILMLAPPAQRYSTAPPLFRIRIATRVAYFEVRAHDASRCTRGRWQTLDKDSAPRGAVSLGRLCKWYAQQAAEYIARRDAYRWAEDPSRDPNRCATRAHFDALSPVLGGSRGGKATNSRASHLATFGHAPATGDGCATHKPTACPTCHGAGKVS